MVRRAISGTNNAGSEHALPQLKWWIRIGVRSLPG